MSNADPVPPAPRPERDPAALFERTLRELRQRGELWVFGYASLIWRPEFRAVEQRAAVVHGFHRALRMRSRINRGTPDRPGLVFALLPGGCCRGMAYRVAPGEDRQVLEQLWAREMPTGVYDPRWLPCRTGSGVVAALGFTLHPRSPSLIGELPEQELIDILRHARGRFGTTLEYLVATAQGLERHGIRDRAIERLVALARRHALLR